MNFRRWARLWAPPIAVQAYTNLEGRTPLALSGPARKLRRVASRMTGHARPAPTNRVNLCCGPILLDDYVNVDINPAANVVIDMEKELLPFPDNSVDVLICIAGINYFDRRRGLEIITDVHRVLRPGGVARFATQDLRKLATSYLEGDSQFFNQTLPDGSVRFPGRTFADKFNNWVSGYSGVGGKHAKYIYDFETLRDAFDVAGFELIEESPRHITRIANVERFEIDHPTDQYMFLEAVKSPSFLSDIRVGTETVDHNGVASPDNPDAQREWQHLMAALDVDRGDTAVMRRTLAITTRQRRLDDSAKLLRDYVHRVPGNRDARKELAEVERRRREERLSRSDIEERQRSLREKFGRENRALGDADHLKFCMEWLRRAQEVSADGGVAAMYDMVTGEWRASYPETTGYIIPTFLSYARLVGDDTYVDAAMEMGDWEIAIQSPIGGAGEPVGVYIPRPRIFNTAQVMLGWLALYRETGDDRYLTAARRAGDFVIGNLDGQGKWSDYTFVGPKSYHARAAWALLELNAVTENADYGSAADLATDWVLRQSQPNGWPANTSLSEDPPWTHLIAYTLVGLVKLLGMPDTSNHHQWIEQVLLAASDGIVKAYTGDNGIGGRILTRGLQGRFDAEWRSNDDWSCITGNAQLAFFLQRFAGITSRPGLATIADSLVADLKAVHLVDGIDDPDLKGGLLGSDPIAGDYLPYSMPNWGVKFFADTLIQRLTPVDEQHYLG